MSKESSNLKGDAQTPQIEKVKEIPINKYSVYEIKSAIDTKIIEFLETHKFEENHFLGNVKLLLGIICLIFTGIAYLYPKPFPDNYYIVLSCVTGYALFSVIYFIFEKYWSKLIFYSGYSAEFLNKYNKGPNPISLLSISSDVKDYCNEYYVWFDITYHNKKTVVTEKSIIYAESVCDSKGYVVKEKVISQFEKIIKDTLAKKHE